ncbi:MAG: glycoside hydrolase family 3 protein [Treponema sp.]|jgi:beta-N-acetylhexosaminidase|nr:glycoside hydrolase family 3 protein [Treponema sp.]
MKRRTVPCSVFFPVLLSVFLAPGGRVWADPDAEDGDAARAAAIVSTLDERLLAAQVILAGVDGRRSLGGAMKELFRDCPAGGIMLFRYNLDAGKEAAKAFLAECAAFIGAAGSPLGIPPLVAVDHEGGPVDRFGPGILRLPAAAFWRELADRDGKEAALLALEEAAFKSGKEIRELGITVNLAPVAEVLNAENFSFLEGRSFGEDPLFVEAASAAFMRGMGRAGISCTLKHFPGNTGIDPHRASPVLGGDAAALAEMARPFAALIREMRVPAVMVSHALVPALDGERIASLSPAVMEGWLREKLGFRGIILADDFSMGAVRDSGGGPEDAAVASLASGADMIMAWPSTLRRTHAAILAALEDGRLSREGLRKSAERIVAEKIRLGLLE